MIKLGDLVSSPLLLTLSSSFRDLIFFDDLFNVFEIL